MDVCQWLKNRGGLEKLTRTGDGEMLLGLLVGFSGSEYDPCQRQFGLGHVGIDRYRNVLITCAKTLRLSLAIQRPTNVAFTSVSRNFVKTARMARRFSWVDKL